MNRATKAVVLSLACASALAAPAAGGPRERVETATYERPAGIHLLDVAWVEVAAGELPQATPMAREKTVSIVVEDDSGNPVAAAVHQGKSELGTICGASESPLTLVNRQPVHVHVYSGEGCSGASIATQGTVTFTFGK